MADKDAIGPTGSKAGRGGYLEYNDENLKKFVSYFSGMLPSGMKPEDLTVLSTTFRRKFPKYKVLPPQDLWKSMVPTLTLLRQIQRMTGVQFTIESAYRSFDVNTKSGGATASAHLDFSGLDIGPQSNHKKVEALVKHFWHEQGKSIDMGLGYYNLNRFHIDTKKYRKWKFDVNRKLWAKKYKEYYSVDLTQLTAVAAGVDAVSQAATAAAGAVTSSISTLVEGFCQRTEMCQYDDEE
jgi:hypothetical protein